MADKYVIGDPFRRQLQETHEIVRSLSPTRGKRPLLRAPRKPPIDRGSLMLIRATITDNSPSTRAHGWRRNTIEADTTAFPLVFTTWDKADASTAIPGVRGTVDTYPAYDPMGNLYPANTPVILTPGEDANGERVFFIVATQRQGPIALTMAQTSGSAGNLTTQCSFLYTVTNAHTGEVLGTSVNPTGGNHKWQRPTVGTMIAATSGYAYYDPQGTLVINIINEILDAEACS